MAISKAPSEEQLINHHENHGNTISQKENGNSPEIKLKTTEVCDITDRECKIAIMKKLNKLKEKSEMMFSEIRNKINEQKEYLTKDIRTLKRIK